MKISLDELKESILGYVGDRTDDITIKLLEDVSDTLEDLKSADIRLKELDDAWRKKYVDRFRGITEETMETEVKEEPEKSKEDITVKDILKEEE